MTPSDFDRNESVALAGAFLVSVGIGVIGGWPWGVLIFGALLISFAGWRWSK